MKVLLGGAARCVAAQRSAPTCSEEESGRRCLTGFVLPRITTQVVSHTDYSQHFWSALPKTERHKRRLILPARIRAETGYGDRVATQLRSGHELEEGLPQPRPEQRAAAQLAQAVAAGARAGAVAAAHPWGRVVAELLQPGARWQMRVQLLRQRRTWRR